MKKLIVLFIISMFLVSNVFAAINDWKQGDNSAPILGTSNPSDIDANLSNYAIDPLDKLLTNYIYGCTLTWATADTITVGIGEVNCTDGTVHRMRKNVATATVTMSNVGVATGGVDTGSDAGAEQASTWYDIYAGADANATTFTVFATKQGTAPTQITYYRYLGSVYNNVGKNMPDFFWTGNGSNVQIMWDIPISVATVLSSGAWSGAISCSAAMPSTSTCGIFGVLITELVGGGDAECFLRVNGKTGSVVNGVGQNWGVNSGTLGGSGGGQLTCFTDASQQIQHYEQAGSQAVVILVKGFYFNR